MRSESEREGLKRRLRLRATRETANLSPGPAQRQGLWRPQGPVEVVAAPHRGCRTSRKHLVRSGLQLSRAAGRAAGERRRGEKVLGNGQGAD